MLASCPCRCRGSITLHPQAFVILNGSTGLLVAGYRNETDASGRVVRVPKKKYLAIIGQCQIGI